MSKVITVFGELAAQITIKRDVKGVIIVEAFNVVPAVKRGFRPTMVQVPMDIREMVLALQKVVTDHCVVLFATMGEGLNGKIKTTDKDDNHSGKPTGG